MEEDTLYFISFVVTAVIILVLLPLEAWVTFKLGLKSQNMSSLLILGSLTLCIAFKVAITGAYLLKY